MINIQCNVIACCAADPSWCLSVSFSFLTPLSSSLSRVFSACVCSHSFSRSSLITVSCHNRLYQHSWCFAIRAVNEISQYFHTFSPSWKAPACYRQPTSRRLWCRPSLHFVKTSAKFCWHLYLMPRLINIIRAEIILLLLFKCHSTWLVNFI